MKKDISKIITKSPNSSGIYKFLNEDDKVIYIGKAKSLRKRLQSYFRKSAKHGVKTKKMIEQIYGVEWIETNSEVEALILEDNLIKEVQPKYNILLKDDKTFQYIKVTIQNDYPEILSVRKIEKDGAKYFGPKTNGGDIKRIIESAKRIFKLCSVRNITINPKGDILKGAKVSVKIGTTPAKRPCLDYHIKRCTGPCVGMITPDEYKLQIDKALEFLSGNYKTAIESLKKQMMDYAVSKKFERAASVRDNIASIEKSAEKQLITDVNLTDRDVIAYVEDLGKNFFILFQIRLGKLIAQEKFVSEGGDIPSEIMEAFLREYYGLAADIPKEIIISTPLEEKNLIEEYVSSQTDYKIKITNPQIGQKDDLIILAEKNARSFAQFSRVKWMNTGRKVEEALEELKKALNLSNIPKRIECYDISHLAGTETVGSMVVFKKGQPANSDYRQFRLRSTMNKNDDFKSMEEVITRRLNYLPDKLHDGYKIKKAKKTDLDFIEKSIKNEKIIPVDLQTKHFYLIEKEIKKKRVIVGFGRVYPHSEKVNEISAIWIDKKERGGKLGYHLIKKLIDRSKAKRFYLMNRQNLEEYYQKFGFETLKDAPKEMKEKLKNCPDPICKGEEMIFMAYQKKKKDISFNAYPDLIVIDGGKGQLHSAHQVLFDKGQNIPMISLAKKEEEVFIPGKSDPINIKKDSEAGYLLQRIRDEAHRFAIEHNRSSRDKKMVKSALDDIQGIGPKMKTRLLTHFGSVARIKDASEVQLQQIAGEELGSRIKDSL